MRILKSMIIILCMMAIMGSLWQINIAIDGLLNDWGYAFPFKIVIFKKLDIYIALDVYYLIIAASSLTLAVIACANNYVES